MTSIQTYVRTTRRLVEYLGLPKAARDERRRDLGGLPLEGLSLSQAIEEGVSWLCRAQDSSASGDGGVSRHYSLISGWAPSYPETTGYIIPTLLEYSRIRGDNAVRIRARRMLDWLVSIQLPEGGFQAGTIDSPLIIPVTFNTGQILLGLASGVREFGEPYREPMRRAADWLVMTQDSDGCWRRHTTPHAAPGEKTYETHVSWGVMEAARIQPNAAYVESALANVRWALKWQKDNGWMDRCCLTDPTRPLTHTLGYALRGILEAHRFSRDEVFLQSGQRMADGLLRVLDDDGFLPGRIGPDWRGTVHWACLTGSAQVAICWWMLFQDTGRPDYLDAARLATRYVRRTMRLEGSEGVRGGVKGSFPLTGEYGRYQYLNWACKFLVDACILEQYAQKSGSSLLHDNRSMLEPHLSL
jgi:hypothetical protein